MLKKTTIVRVHIFAPQRPHACARPPPRAGRQAMPQMFARGSVIPGLCADRRPQYGGGGRLVDRDAEKQKLQNAFAYGEHAPQAGAAPPAAPPPPKPRSEAAELHEQISQEITERQQFVEQMRASGNRQHETLMQQQIAERLADLRTLESHMGNSHVS